MTKQQFFQMIAGTENIGSREYLIRLIEARGFLLERNNEDYFFSDNSHKDDANYLDSLLKKHGLGYVLDNNIILNHNQDPTRFEEEFAQNEGYRTEASLELGNWKLFRQKIHGDKVAVAQLEAFIARYVKAISACGVFTAGSCDGNHKDKSKLFLQFKWYGHVWHRLICQYCLGSKFDLPWDKYYVEINLVQHDRYRVYYELNKAAEYLYGHRIELRAIKQEALKSFSHGYLKKQENSDNVEKIFEERVKELIKEYGL